MKRIIFLLCALGLSLFAQEEVVGVRPYEMDWAGRTEDAWPALVDFEDLSGWRVEVEGGAVASFVRTREQQLFGKYVGKLTYRGDGELASHVWLRPPKPLPIQAPFDMVGCWIYGNNWGWMPEVSTPQVDVIVLFGLPDGTEMEVRLVRVNWKEWFLALKRLEGEQETALNQKGVTFTGFRIEGGQNKDDRVIYFDNLSVHKEAFKPLTFKPRPKRGIPMFPGQDEAANTGPGKLPFPTREDTILPDSAHKDGKNQIRQVGDAFILDYAGPDGRLQFTYMPKTGRWDDITASWNGGGQFNPLANGGAQFPKHQFMVGAFGVDPQSAQHLGTNMQDGNVISRWKYISGEMSMEVTYELGIKGKTLVLDTRSKGGSVAAVKIGGVMGLTNARAVPIPYYDYRHGGRPHVIVAGTENDPLFVSTHICWYRSNASRLWGSSGIQDGIPYANGGAEYVPRTDGKRNDCYERFFVTIGPKFEEHLPNIPNPKSPWKHVTGTYQWRAHGASDRDHDKEFWKSVWRNGMRKVLVTDHESCWRDGGESFTFRTKAAPKKGGDKGMADYAKYMQETLGFIYGPYNNFTDFAPVNEYWDVDMVGRMENNQLQTAWMRCYGPKPLRAVEYCAELSPIIQRKFGFSTAYCDVHTAMAPWWRTDYDYRVPGAATFAMTFYAYGEVMLHQKKAWNGPVYSEGGYHCYYSGLTDGNYAQDRHYDLPNNPWLVDFDLRKIHELECNFGMGNHEMFWGDKEVRSDIDMSVDRFLAATVAFGHPGFLVSDGGLRRQVRGYFMLQQLHSRYTQASVDTIEYADGSGRLWATSLALANDAYKRSQLAIRYKDGTRVVVNGNKTERMVVSFGGKQFDLPPNGYAGWTEDGTIMVFSGDEHLGGKTAGRKRCDYAETPDYIFIDGRDAYFQRFPKAAGSGAGVARKLESGDYEYIPYGEEILGWALPVVKAIALDDDMRELGEVEVRHSRGYAYVMHKKGAKSYRMILGKTMPEIGLRTRGDLVWQGENVNIQGKNTHEVVIPEDAKPLQRIWFNLEGQWIDFTVMELVEIEPRLDGDEIVLEIHPLRSEIHEVECIMDGQQKKVVFANSGMASVRYPLPKVEKPGIRTLDVTILSGKAKQEVPFGLISEMKYEQFPFDFGTDFKSGICFRGKEETDEFEETGAVVAPVRKMSCGRVIRDGLFAHPPYMGGTGYSFSVHRLKLPAKKPVVFRGMVGKRDGSFLGDGIWFSFWIRQGGESWTKLGETSVTQFGWKPFEVDLGDWMGQEVELKLITDPGPNDDTVADWGAWAELIIQSKQKSLLHKLDISSDAYRTEVSKNYVPGLTIQQLRSARRGWLCYQGQGFESSPNFLECYGFLNEVEIGLLKHSEGGNEVHNIWSKDIMNELPRKAIEQLDVFNQFQILNTAGDNFKLRRFSIVLELADGQMVSSRISTAIYTQPGSWRYAEGILVPSEETIKVPISF